MLKQISNHLTALEAYLKQIHLLAHSRDYQAHLLAERLYEPIANDIDRIKELSLGLGEDKDIAFAFDSLGATKDILKDYPISELNLPILWQAVKELELKTLSLIEYAAKEYSSRPDFVALQGVLNALGDISEKRIRDIYLINTQL